MFFILRHVDDSEPHTALDHVAQYTASTGNNFADTRQETQAEVLMPYRRRYGFALGYHGKIRIK